MSETTPDNQVQDPLPHGQTSLAGSDDRPVDVDEAAWVDTEPDAAEAPPSGDLSSGDLPSDPRKWRPTSDFPLQDPAPQGQTSLAGSDDRPVDGSALVDTGPDAAEAPPSRDLSSRDLPSDPRKWRSTSDFPQDPSALSRQMLETHYREMRASHIFLARSRGQQKRHSDQFNRQRKELFAILHGYQEKITLLGAEKLEALQIAKDFQRDLEAFERDQQTLDQLVNEFETSNETIGFWDTLKITQFLQRIRQLLRGRGARP